MEPESDTTAFGWLVGLASDGSFAGVAPAAAAALIEDKVWMGAHAMILPGVSIDDVVEKDTSRRNARKLTLYQQQRIK